MNIRVIIITVSDRASKGERADATGPALQELLQANGYEVAGLEIVPDEQRLIGLALRRWADSREIDLILTNGGTGLSPRDVTPEATASTVERLVPGLPEAMRAASLQKTKRAMLSRAIAGVRGCTLIVNLPGSPKGALECMEVILPVLPHAVELLQGEVIDCADQKRAANS